VGDDGFTQYVADHGIDRPTFDSRTPLQAMMEIVIDPRYQLTHDVMIAASWDMLSTHPTCFL
jgi:hypothetical protein